MLYAFILGRVFTLSIAEILWVMESLGLDIKRADVSPEVLIFEVENPPDMVILQKRLGGTIKILQIKDAINLNSKELPLDTVSTYLTFSRLKQLLPLHNSRTEIGLSIYSLTNSPPLLDHNQPYRNRINKFGMVIKRVLKTADVSARIIFPETNRASLSSATVQHNQLLQKGVELSVLLADRVAYLATTLSVQDFEDYSRRDFLRPVRDMKRGMTPPKLAQLMLNLSGVTPVSTIFDPFCGLGTFVQEGLLLGYKMIGSDIDKRAIEGSRTNLEWICDRYNIPAGRYELIVEDAKKLSRGVSAIVTEGTLGEAFTRFPTLVEIKKVFIELTNLYTICFTKWHKLLPKGARIVMCLPSYRKNNNEFVMLPSLDFALKTGYSTVGLIPPNLMENRSFLRITKRNTAIYDRKDQIVAREVIVFEKV